MYLAEISLCNLYDFEVSISSYGQELRVRSVSRADTARHIADFVTHDQWGYPMAWQGSALIFSCWLLST